MSDFTVRTRYVTRPGSNVGGIVATAAGRRHRVTCDQSRNLADNHRDAAVILAARLGYAADRVPSHWDAVCVGAGRYVFTIPGGPEPTPDIRRAVDGSELAPWPAAERGQLEATARRVISDHGHDGYWDHLTRSACGACALAGYGASDDDGRAPYGPNYAAWPRVYVQSGRVIPIEWRPAFLRELATTTDNARYRDCLARDVLTYGARFSDGSTL